MRPTEALATLARMGLSLRPLGGKLYVEPRDLITPEARSIIVEHRDDLLALVSTGEPIATVAPVASIATVAAPSAALGTDDPADLIAAYHQRLAIVLEAGDVSPAEAVPIASEQVGATIEVGGQRLAAGPVKASLKTPDSFSLSLASDLNPQLQLLADVSWTGWSSIPKLEFTRANGSILNSVEYNWKDTWRYSLGANFKLNDKLMLRGGVAFDESPMDTAHRTPRLPDGDRTWLSVGGRYMVAPTMALDFGYTHIFIKDPKINNRNDGSTAGNALLDGTYSSNVNIVSASFTYTFR